MSRAGVQSAPCAGWFVGQLTWSHREPVCREFLWAPALLAHRYILTLCYRSRASAWPTQTRTQLGSLEEEEKEPHDKRKTSRSNVPLRRGAPSGHHPLRPGALTREVYLPLRPGVLGTLDPHTQASQGVHVSPSLWAISALRKTPEHNTLSDSGIPMGKKREKGPKKQECAICRGRQVPPSSDLTLLDSSTKDIPGHEA